MPRVITLGTGSGKPTLKRSVSAVAVVWEGEWVLFDCGEATQIQIMRAGLHSSRLRAIFITHLHGDHFNGLAGFLSTMGLDRREEEIVVVGPPGIREYLALLRRLKILYVAYPLEVLEFGPERFNTAIPVYSTQKFTVSALPLDHRIFTLGYRIEERARPGRFNFERAMEIGVPEGPLFGRLQAGHDITLVDGRTVRSSDVVGPPRSGKILAYCTDTRPCETGIQLGLSADLLIHEATFADDLGSEAAEYGHSTARQAGRIAQAARPKRMVITHISARYPNATPLLGEAAQIFPNV